MSEQHPGAQALAAIMASRSMTAADVLRAASAQQLPLSQAMLSGIMTGKRGIGIDSAKTLAAVLDVPAATFLPELAEMMAAQEPGSPGLGRAPLHRFVLSAMNERKQVDDGATAELAGTIAEKGLLQPLLVSRDETCGSLMVEDGGRRWRALKLLEADGRLPPDLAAHGIPYWIMQGDEAQRRTASILANLQREDVNPMDRAEAYVHLRDLGMTTSDMAKAMGCTTNHYRQYLQIADTLSEADKAMLRANLITFRQARDLVQEHKPPAFLRTPQPVVVATPSMEQVKALLRPVKHHPTPEDYRVVITAPQSDAEPVRDRVKRVLSVYTGIDTATMTAATSLADDLDIAARPLTLIESLNQEFGIMLEVQHLDHVGSVGELTRAIIGHMSPKISGDAGKAEAGPRPPAVGGGITRSAWVVDSISRRLDGTPIDIVFRHAETGAEIRFVPEQRDIEDAAE